MSDPRTVHTYCRICQAHCGLLIDVDGERIVRVNGDPEHPVSRGYTCSKGRALGDMHHDPDRLEQPQLNGQPAPWDAVMTDLGARLRALVDEHGPDAIACYRSTGWVLDAIGRSAADRWIRALGTAQIYSPATIDTPNRMLVPDLVVGAPFIQPVVDWEQTQLLIVFGQNFVVSHGHATAVPDPVRRIRGIKDRGGSVIVVDPRRTETARLADLHLEIAPGTDVALAAHLVRLRLQSRCDNEYLDRAADRDSIPRLSDAVAPYDRDLTARFCELDPLDLDRAATLLDSVDRVSCVSGTGVSMGPAANATEWLGWALAAVTGSLDRDGGMLVNPGVIRPQSETGPTTMDRVTGPPPSSRPEFEHAYGEYPSAILCDEIRAGTVRALISFGGNVLASFPDSAKTRDALASLDVLAVTELRHTQTTSLATHVLATCDQLERHDVTFFMDQAFPVPFAQYTPPVVSPVGDRRPLWWVMTELAHRMGMEVPGLAPSADEEELLARVIKRSRVPFDALRAAPSGVRFDDAPRSNWLVPDRLPRGALDLAPPPLVAELQAWAADQAGHRVEPAVDGSLTLICRRLPHQMNSDLQELPSQHRAPFATLLMNQRDARPRGLTDGDRVKVTSASGATEAVVEVTDHIRPGVVSLPHAWKSPAVNNLTSTDGLDPLTGMPRFTGFSVSVTASRS
jgi:anaerobic selenocysteine-containing dehydrogenase